MTIKREFSYKIYYKDTDAGGVLYYANYLCFLEKARTDFFEQCGITAKSFHNLGWFLAVKKIDCEYLKPVFYGDTIKVTIDINSLKRTNLTVNYSIYNENSSLIFKGSTLLVSVDTEMKIIKLPHQLIKFLKEFV